jgi:hypothetical protein
MVTGSWLRQTSEAASGAADPRPIIPHAGGRLGPGLLVIAALLARVAIVDPWREFMSEDDGWAYARSVEHLLATGRYRLDAWSAANMPVQIYLAAALARVSGIR